VSEGGKSGGVAVFQSAAQDRDARHLVISVQALFTYFPFTLPAGKSYKLLLGIARQFALGQLALP